MSWAIFFQTQIPSSFNLNWIIVNIVYRSVEACNIHTNSSTAFIVPDILSASNNLIYSPTWHIDHKTWSNSLQQFVLTYDIRQKEVIVVYSDLTMLMLIYNEMAR